jgi:hypothetical protein
MKKSEFAAHYFGTVPTATEAFETADGNVFVGQHFAEAYANERLTEKQVTVHKRADYEVAQVEANPNELTITPEDEAVIPAKKPKK